MALIGYGVAGADFHAPLIGAVDGMRVAAIVTANPERQQRAQREVPSATLLSTVEDVWHRRSEFDLVVVAVPNRAHATVALAALQAGIPVVVDKPLTVTSREARQLLETSARLRVPLTVFQNRRWDGDFLTVRRLLETHRLGPVTRFESRYELYQSLKPHAWRENPAPEEGGGVLYDLGGHLIDQALVLFGRPARVYAELAQRRPDAKVDDDSFVALQFESRIVAHLWMSKVARSPAPRFRVSGLVGAYEKHGQDPQWSDLQAGRRPGAPGWGREPIDRWGRLVTEIGGTRAEMAIESVPGAYECFYETLRDSLLGGGALPVDPADALATVQVIEAATESARRRRVVDLPSPRGTIASVH